MEKYSNDLSLLSPYTKEALKMKKVEFVSNGVRFFLTEEDTTTDVVIYDLEATIRTSTVVELARGSSLKEACNNWIVSFEDIYDKRLIDAVNGWRERIGISILDVDKDPDILYEIDDFINSQTDVNLYKAISNDMQHYYVDWSKVESCGA